MNDEPADDPDAFEARRDQALVAFLSADTDAKQRLIADQADLLLYPEAVARLRDEARFREESGAEDGARIAADVRACADLLADLTAAAQTVSDEAGGDPAVLMLELRALAAADDAETDADNLARQIEICEDLLTLVPRQTNPRLWPMIQGTLGNARQRYADVTADAEMYRWAADAYRAAMLVWTPDRAPTQWATIQSNLGAVFMSLGELVGDIGALRRGEACLRASLDVRTREHDPEGWAAAQTNLGNLLRSLGLLAGDEGALREAIEVYRLALQARTRERAPLDWAHTQNNLGAALEALGVRTGDVPLLQAARAAYAAALLEWTEDRVPADWAIAQNNLGNALQAIAELVSDASLLQDAISAYRLALRQRTRAGAPIAWATTQNNLAAALQCLGGLVGDASLVRQALVAYEEALTERTRARAPMAWAATQNNIGNALVILGELSGNPETMSRAEAAFRASLLERTRKRAPAEWATTQSNLGNVLQTLGEFNEDEFALRQAESAYRLALEERPRAAAPLQWAITQNNLGITLRNLGTLTRRRDLLEGAVSAHRAALEERSPERTPSEWAGAQTNLGTALQCLGEMDDDHDRLRLAEDAYRRALDTLRDSGAEDTAQGVAGALSRLLVGRRRYAEAAAVIVSALEHSDAGLIDADRTLDGGAQAVARVGGLHSLLSLCRLREQPENSLDALLAAESGRARLLADALSLDRVRLDEIENAEVRAAILRAHQRRNALAARLGYRPGLEAATPGGGSALSPDARAGVQAEYREAEDHYVSLCRRHGLVEAIAPVSPADVRAAVPGGGALLLPVLTPAEAFAFVVTDSPDAIHVVELPRLNSERVRTQLSGAEGWVGAYHQRWAELDGEASGSETAAKAEQRWRNRLAATRAWLWESLFDPIHRHLQDVARLLPGAPVVLLPPGLLGVLPLQAAGPGPDGRDFGDHWTVSFAPSIRTLLTCQSRRRLRQAVPMTMLAVIDPTGDLEGARQEAPLLRDHFALADQIVLQGADATLAGVLQHLPTATHTHVSAHGWYDAKDPLRSGLRLADHPLRLDMLRHARLDRARLVFLSACESGRADIRRLAEEFIGLPTGIVQAGAACAIATLWPIDDSVAFLVADKFYDQLLDAAGAERTPPAVALRNAVAWLRQVKFADLRRRFDVVATAQGPALLLSARTRFTVTDVAAPGDELLLPLGPDAERPFEDPEHWAAFTVTGA